MINQESYKSRVFDAKTDFSAELRSLESEGWREISRSLVNGYYNIRFRKYIVDVNNVGVSHPDLPYNVKTTLDAIRPSSPIPPVPYKTVPPVLKKYKKSNPMIKSVDSGQFFQMYVGNGSVGSLLGNADVIDLKETNTNLVFCSADVVGATKIDGITTLLSFTGDTKQLFIDAVRKYGNKCFAYSDGDIKIYYTFDEVTLTLRKDVEYSGLVPKYYTNYSMAYYPVQDVFDVALLSFNIGEFENNDVFMPFSATSGVLEFQLADTLVPKVYGTPIEVLDNGMTRFSFPSNPVNDFVPRMDTLYLYLDDTLLEKPFDVPSSYTDGYNRVVDGNFENLPIGEVIGNKVDKGSYLGDGAGNSSVTGFSVPIPSVTNNQISIGTPLAEGERTDNNNPFLTVYDKLFVGNQRLARNVVAYSNEALNIYVICFKTLGLTYVYNTLTGQWSRSDEQFEHAWIANGLTYRVDTSRGRVSLNKDIDSTSYSQYGKAYDDLVYCIATLVDSNPSQPFLESASPIYVNGVYDKFFDTNFDKDIYIQNTDGSWRKATVLRNAFFEGNVRLHWDTSLNKAIKLQEISPVVGLYEGEILKSSSISHYLVEINYTTNKALVIPPLPDSITHIDVFVKDGNTVTVEKISVSVGSNVANISGKELGTAYGNKVICVLSTGIKSKLRFNNFAPNANIGKTRFLESNINVKDSFCSNITVRYKNVGEYTNNIWDETFVTSRIEDTVRTLVPKNSSVGKYLQLEVEHGTPQETFKCTGLSFRWRVLGNTNKGTRNEEV